MVPVASDQMMVTAAKRYNPSVKFTIYPDANHNSWERTCNNDSVYQWLPAQKNSLPNRKIFFHHYLINKQVNIENDSLKAKTTNRPFPLKPAGDHLFFIYEQLPVDVRFILNAKGKVDSFLLFEKRKILFQEGIKFRC